MISMLSWPFVVLERIERGTWTVLVGLLFLAGGFLFRWCLVPSTLLSGFDGGDFRIEFIEPTGVIALRMMVLITVAVLLFGLIRGERHRFAARAAVWALLAATLTFPYTLRLWDPEITFDSETIWNSLDAVALSAMDHSYNEQQLDWRGYEQIIVLSTKRLAQTLGAPLAVILPSAPGGGKVGPEGTEGRIGSPLEDGLDLSIFRLARLADVMSEIFGYSNAFLNLAGKGWYLSIIGTIVALVGLYLPRDRGNRFFLRDIRWVAGCYALLLIALLSPRLVSEILLTEADVAFARGDSPTAERDLHEAARWKPTIGYSLLFHEKLGQITRARYCNNCPESLLSVAYNYLIDGMFVDGIEELERFRARYPDRLESRYWLAFAYEQRGIELFNSGETSAAAESWWKALQYGPTNTLSLWGLALAQFRMGQFDAAATSLNAIVKLQNTVSFKPFPVTSQWRVAEAWAALKRGDAARAHDYYSLSVTPENW